jgi:hypothetical protein
MSAATQTDWFAQNAPQAVSGDWFDTNAPKSAPPSATDALSKATSIGPGPGWFQRQWDAVKAGLVGAQEGGGLKPQPTTLGNAAEFTGMLGKVASDLSIAPELAEGAGMVENALPSTEKAGKIFQELKGAIGNHTVPVTDRLADTLGEIKQAVDTGSTLPSVINKFVTRIADVDEGPLTYAEARQFYHNVSELSASERMAAKPSDLRLIQLFKHALGDSIAQTAENAGRLQDYQKAMSGYSAAKRMSDTASAVKTAVVKAAVPTILTGLGAGGGVAAYGYLKDMLGK